MSQLGSGAGHEDRHADEVSYRSQGLHGKLWPQTVFRSNFVTHNTTDNQAIQGTMTNCSDTLWPYQPGHPTHPVY